MSGYFDALEAELRAAVPRVVAVASPVGRRGGNRWAKGRRPRMGQLGLALGVALPVLVAVVAIALLGHHRQPENATRPPSPTVKQAPVPAPPSVTPVLPGSRRAIGTVPAGRPLTLTGDSFGGLRFGTRRARAIAFVRRTLGRPATVPSTAGCGVSAVDWPLIVDPHTGQLVRAYSLELAFAHGRLVGYQFGGARGRTSGRGNGYAAATVRGLRLGDTLARGRRLYGRAFTISSAQGGSWSVRTPQGRLDGYASGPSRDGDLSRRTVTSIDAGDVGCPALSP